MINLLRGANPSLIHNALEKYRAEVAQEARIKITAFSKQRSVELNQDQKKYLQSYGD